MNNNIENKELWELDFEFYCSNTLWINKPKVDEIISYMKENYSVFKKIKPPTNLHIEENNSK